MWETWSDTLAAILSFVSLTIGVGLAIWTPIFLCIKYDKLMDTKFENKFGALYENIKPNNAKSVAYSVVFLFRRVSLCVTILFLDSRPQG